MSDDADRVAAASWPTVVHQEDNADSSEKTSEPMACDGDDAGTSTTSYVDAEAVETSDDDDGHGGGDDGDGDDDDGGAGADEDDEDDDDDDPWASEDETSDDWDEWGDDYLYDNEYGSDLDYEDYEERRRADEKKAARRAAAYYLKKAQTPRIIKEQKLDEEFCLHWVDGKKQSRKIVTGVAREWRFMVDWLHALKHRMHLEDHTRVDCHGTCKIGRDGEEDWWINVLITEEKPGSREAEHEMLFNHSFKNWDVLGMDQERRYKMIRESIILQSMMAQVDYDAWLDAFLNIVAFTPPQFVHLNQDSPGADKKKLPRRFSISFPTDWHIREYQWTPFVKDLFQPKKWSGSFESTYCVAYQTMVAKGFDMENLEPIPIKLRFAPPHCGYLRQITILKMILHVITKIKKIEERWKKRRQWRASPQLKAPPVLFLESLDLDLRAFTVYPSVLNTVEKLVATAGVRIENLTLPGHKFDGVYDETQLRSAWASLLCTVMGIQDFRQGSRARVSTLPGISRLVIPSFYMYGQYYLPFFMAARDARGVYSVRIEMGEMLRPRRTNYDKFFGSLVGYAFFSKHSKSSITSLDIDGMVFTSRTMAGMERVVNAEDPLDRLYWEITGNRDRASPADVRWISVKMGTPLTPIWVSSPTRTPGPWTCLVVRDDPSKSTRTVYLPGFGLCDIDRSRVPNKKRRTTFAPDSPSLTMSAMIGVPNHLFSLSLQLRSEDDTIDNEVNRVLDATNVARRLGALAGGYLDSFALTSDLTTEETAREILNNYKKLRSLRLADGTMDDMSVFVVAYDNGSKISSLDLSGCQIPTPLFKLFLRWLTTDDKARNTLRRLRFGEEWEPSFFTSSTVDVISSMLSANKHLTHLHINIPGRADMWTNVSAFQGENLPLCSLPNRHRLAFASVLHCRNKSSEAQVSTMRFDASLMKRILAFVAPPERRTVIIQPPPPPPVERDPWKRLARECYGDAGGHS